MGIYENVKQAFQDIVAPEIKNIHGDIKAIHVELKRLDEKMDSGFARLDQKIDLTKNELQTQIKALDQKVDLIRNELISEIRRSDSIVESELRRIDNELALSRELRDSISELKERIFVLEAKAA
jgi:ABC-type phosphate transport system auxiliary subunit